MASAITTDSTKALQQKITALRKIVGAVKDLSLDDQITVMKMAAADLKIGLTEKE